MKVVETLAFVNISLKINGRSPTVWIFIHFPWFKKCTSCGVALPDADDEDQSSKPTFSVRELRAILHERNELKLKLNRAEEQLQALQAEPQPDR